MLCASVAPSIWCENSLQRRMNELSWTSWEGLAIIISPITGNETQRVTWFSQKSLRNPWLAGAAPVAPELRSDRTMEKFVVTPLLTAFLSFLLHLCKWKRREEEKQSQVFQVIWFNLWLNMIKELKIWYVTWKLNLSIVCWGSSCRKLDSFLGRFGSRVSSKAVLSLFGPAGLWFLLLLLLLLLLLILYICRDS